MEGLLVLPRCISQTLNRPVCHNVCSSYITVVRSMRQVTPTSSRSFASTSYARQNTPSQPVPLSNVRNTEDEFGALPPNERTNPRSNQKPRIDLSSLNGIPPSYQPSNPPTLPNRTASRTGTASNKLDALWGKSSNPKSSENPFQRAVRQTDDLNRTSPEQRIDFSSFLDKLERPDRRPAMPSTGSGKIPLRLGPMLGRTQAVDPGRNMDLTRAFLQLDYKCRNNQIRQDSAKQRFHVRRGQKKKLDRMRRWRIAFKAGFVEECARIRRMKNQGW